MQWILCLTLMLALALPLLSPREAAADEPAPSEPPLYLLTYDHGGMVLWGRDHFLERLRSAVDWLDRYPSFKIGLDNEAYTYDYLAEKEPHILEQLRGILRRFPNRFGVGTCTYGQPLSHFINEESNVRQIGYALEACRKHLGRVPPVYLMSEHAMHSQIPQLLRGFGFQGSIMRTHFMMYGYNPTFDVATGWWVGLDGSRIPTVPTYHDQGASFGITTTDNWILTRYPGPECNTPLEEFRKRHQHIRPLLASRADDAGLRQEGLLKQYGSDPGYRWVLLEDLLRVFPAPEAELKTLPNDFVVRMPWGYCGNEIWNLNRKAEVAVLTAERLAALELLLGGQDREAELREAWRNLLVAQHHDIQICGLLDEARKFLPASLAASERVTEASLGFVASRMRGSGPAQVTVFNPLSWRRKGWAQATVTLPAGQAEALELRRGSRRVPSVTLSSERHPDGSLREAVLAFPADLPGLGCASYSVVPRKGSDRPSEEASSPRVSGLTITTPHHEAVLHPDGGLASLTDRRTGRPLLQDGKRSVFFAARVEGQERESRGRWELLPFPRGASWVTAREQGEIGGIPYTLELTFHADTPRIDCRAHFRFSGQKIGRVSEDQRDSVSGFVHEEKLRLKLFPAVSEKAVGVRDLPFAVAETPGSYVEGIYWTALSDGRVGWAVFNRGAMGSVREADGGFSVPLAYAMYYVWGTRMLTGDYGYELALLPFTGSWQRADLHRRAMEYGFPLVGTVTAPGDGSLGSTLSLVKAGSPSVLLSALYPEGGRLIARLYEHRGRPGRAEVRLLKGAARYAEVDLAGRELGDVSGALDFAPWRIRTVRVQAEQSRR